MVTGSAADLAADLAAGAAAVFALAFFAAVRAAVLMGRFLGIGLLGGSRGIPGNKKGPLRALGSRASGGIVVGSPTSLGRRALYDKL
jgi:hypothetical protein